MAQQDWKEKLSMLTGTPCSTETTPEETIIPIKLEKQTLRVEMDKRNGKPATIISGFTCTDDQIKEIGKELKVACGTGGSVRGGEILIQGDMRQKVAKLLEDKGHKVRRINFA